MAGKSNTLSKKNIIAIIAIIVLLFIAGLSVGIFLADKGKTEAVDENTTVQTEPRNPDANNNEQPGNTDPENPTTDPDFSGVEGNENTNTTENTEPTAPGNNGNVEGTVNNGATNTGVTTGTDVNNVGETTITRVEEQEKLVSRDYWDWWTPIDVAVASTVANLDITTPDLTVKKSVITKTGDENLTYVGQDITYVIEVANNGNKDVQNIEITDRIPQNTSFVSIDDEENNEIKGTPVTTTVNGKETVVGVKWIATIPAGETIRVSFTVNVNNTMLNETGEEVPVTGTILNTAIANGQESNEGNPTETSIITNNKSSVITRNGEVVGTAKVGDRITYTITVTNTGDAEGTTFITDTVPAGTKFVSAEDNAIVSTSEDGKTIVTWSVKLDANSTVTREFTVEVESIDGKIKNIANVGGIDTNEKEDETADITVNKVVTDIKREGVSIGTDAKVKAGDVIEYKITVTNNGSIDLRNVVVDEKLTNIVLDETQLQIGYLVAGDSREITATYTVTYEADIKNKEDRTILNEVFVSGETVPDPEKPGETPTLVDDEDEEETQVEVAPSVSVEKTATAVNGQEIITGITKVRPGDVIEYTIIVDNTGNKTLENIEITDSLDVKFNEQNKPANTVIKTITKLAPDDEPVEIKVYYTVTEDDCANLEIIANVATATADDGTTNNDNDTTVLVNVDRTVSITKVWNDNENQDGKRPSTITISLYADGTYVKSETISGTTYTFTKLPKYNAQGGEIVYTVTENAVAEYTTSYSQDTLTITNTHTPEQISAIIVTKYWDDKNNQDGIRPNSVSVSLLANEAVKETVNVTSADNWVTSFENLPVYENGEKITYTVRENNVAQGYTAEVSGSVDEGFAITNTHTPATTEVTVTKSWDDNNNQDGIRPTTVSVSLMNGTAVVDTQSLNKTNNWTYTFNNLDKKASGTDIVYTVVENNVPTGYSAEVTADTSVTSGYGFIVTNTHTPEIIDIPVTKVWEDYDNHYGARKTVTVDAKVGNKVKQTITISADEDGNWNGTFTNLPKYSNGQKIQYTISERAVEGYTTKSIVEDETTGAYTITNTYNNVIINKKTLTSTEISETTEQSKVDVVFVLDISGSMVNNKVSNGNGGQITRAEAMVNATNKAITEIMKNSNNRIGIVMYSGDVTTVFTLGGYTPLTTTNNVGEYLKYSKTTTTITTNVEEKAGNQITKEVTGGTYTQLGIATGADILANATNTEGRTPVIILLTDGDPTYGNTNYSSVPTAYNVGTGSTTLGELGYLTILTANSYKAKVNNNYKTAENPNIAQIYTIGLGMSGIYNETTLNPNAENVSKCNGSTVTGASNLYAYLKGTKTDITTNNKTESGRKPTNVVVSVPNPYTDYSYADGSWSGEMDADTLASILTSITQNITKHYATTTTYTTNINRDQAIVELENLDINEKIQISLDGVEAQEGGYTVTELETSGVLIHQKAKYYIDLKASLFDDVKSIEITYIEVSTNA